MQEIIRIRITPSTTFKLLLAAVHVAAVIAVVISGLYFWMKLLLAGLVIINYLMMYRKYRRDNPTIPQEIIYRDDLSSNKKRSQIKQRFGWQIISNVGMSAGVSTGIESTGIESTGIESAGIESAGIRNESPAILLPQSIVLGFYILLVFRLQDSGRVIHLPIFSFDISKDDFRALKILLRFNR